MELNLNKINYKEYQATESIEYNKLNYQDMARAWSFLQQICKIEDNEVVTLKAILTYKSEYDKHAPNGKGLIITKFDNKNYKNFIKFIKTYAVDGKRKLK